MGSPGSVRSEGMLPRGIGPKDQKHTPDNTGKGLRVQGGRTAGQSRITEQWMDQRDSDNSGPIGNHSIDLHFY
jgi:hypothetical protein